MSSQRRVKSIGDQELALLRFVSDHTEASVGQAAEGFGQPRGLARSTVLTMMERLRKKGHLTRKQVGGVYQYAPRTAPGTAVRQAVQTFVDRTLGALELLRQDGVSGPRAWARLFWFMWVRPGMMRKIFSAWAKYFAPGFHPWNEDDRHLIAGFELSGDYGQEPARRVRSAA